MQEAELMTMNTAFDVQKIRADFPILSMEVYGKPLIYLDNAASAQKPLQVMNAMNEAMTSGYANVHRGLTIFRIKPQMILKWHVKMCAAF